MTGLAWVLAGACGQHPDLPWTDDTTSAADRLAMAGVCARCPVLASCTAWARDNEPTAGFWAGRDYTPQVPAWVQLVLSLEAA